MQLVQLAVLHIILVSALFTETSGKHPVLGVLGPQPHCASRDLACLKHRRSIERQDSRWLSPLLKDNQNNFRQCCNFQSAFLRF